MVRLNLVSIQLLLCRVMFRCVWVVSVFIIGISVNNVVFRYSCQVYIICLGQMNVVSSVVFYVQKNMLVLVVDCLVICSGSSWLFQKYVVKVIGRLVIVLILSVFIRCRLKLIFFDLVCLGCFLIVYSIMLLVIIRQLISLDRKNRVCRFQLVKCVRCRLYIMLWVWVVLLVVGLVLSSVLVIVLQCSDGVFIERCLLLCCWMLIIVLVVFGWYRVKLFMLVFFYLVCVLFSSCCIGSVIVCFLDGVLMLVRCVNVLLKNVFLFLGQVMLMFYGRYMNISVMMFVQVIIVWQGRVIIVLMLWKFSYECRFLFFWNVKKFLKIFLWVIILVMIVISMNIVQKFMRQCVYSIGMQCRLKCRWQKKLFLWVLCVVIF